MLKKLLIIISVIVLTVTSLPMTTAYAAIVNAGTITIGTVSGNTGDTVVVPITIAENPGICAITISITYDSSALEFVEHMKGNVIYEYMVKDHPSNNLIRLVTCEQGNKYNNGTVISLKFNIKKKTKAGFYKINISYRAGDFCNWKLDKIMPVIVPGGVNVNLSSDNCPHISYGSWSTAAVAACTEPGLKKRTCNDCGHIDLAETEPLGHEFSEDFTIDKEATENETGLMSRHCIRCSAFTDQISYTLDNSEEGNINNNIYETVTPNDYIDELIKDQYPADDSSEPDSSASSNNVSSSKPQITESNPQPPFDIESEIDVTPSVIEQINEDIRKTVKEKIAEILPDIDSIIKSVKTAVLLLALIILI